MLNGCIQIIVSAISLDNRSPCFFKTSILYRVISCSTARNDSADEQAE